MLYEVETRTDRFFDGFSCEAADSSRYSLISNLLFCFPHNTERRRSPPLENYSSIHILTISQYNLKQFLFLNQTIRTVSSCYSHSRSLLACQINFVGRGRVVFTKQKSNLFLIAEIGDRVAQR